MRFVELMVCALIASLFLASKTFGQSSVSSGEIHGTITDSSGAVVPDASIVVTNASVGLTRNVISSQVGTYHALLLPPGLYQVTAGHNGFASQIATEIQVRIGEITDLDFKLSVGTINQSINVQAELSPAASERVQQSNTIGEADIQSLPINRRDFLTFSLLAPGVVDSVALADSNDFRVVQTRDSGLSFFGSNGRGNSVTTDGGETNDNAGGVRATLSQEAVQEFQINRVNYSAELGGANGGVINIVSKTGTNDLHGSAFAFFRDYHFDAANPFALTWTDGKLVRVKPPSDRQQFGTALGGPIKHNRAYYFFSFEGLNRDESNAVSTLDDPSIFLPTPEQEAILAGLPPASAASLRAVLTSPERTRDFFQANSGVFPFSTENYKTSIRIDNNLDASNHLNSRYSYANIDESNPNLRDLRGLTRGYVTDTLDQTIAVGWTRTANSRLLSESRAQFNYRSFLVHSNDSFGPEININGFGYFNRDYTLPSRSFSRRLELSNAWTASIGNHILKFGGDVLVRGAATNAEVFFGGRFTFGTLPGATVSSALASTTITAVQAFNLGLPQTYQQAAGDPKVGSTNPSMAIYIQDNWKAGRTLTLNYGLRYELDDRRSPLPTDLNNLAPRIGFAWTPGSEGRTTFRGGYGIYYEPTYYQVDWVSNALNEINGHRQIAQILTTIQTTGAANSANVYKTLVSQGIITFPIPTQSITPADVAQFGITFPQDGPVPPLSVLFRNSKDFVNAYSQQASLGFERRLAGNFSISSSYIFARTLKIVRARDDNLLPAPVDPILGIPVWSTPYFKNPIVLQDNVYEPTGRAFYNGLTVEVRKQFRRGMVLNANYTLSKAIDEVVDFNSDFQANNQLDLRAERSLSSFDQRHKFVFYGMFSTPSRTDNGLLSSLLSDFTMTPVLRANSGRPFNLLAGFDLNGDRHPTTDRPAFAGRNTGIGPDFWTVDFRLMRELRLNERVDFQITVEGFNVLNRMNFGSVNNVTGNISPPFNLKGRRDLSPSQPLGFTSAMDPRQLQFGIRARF